MAAESLEIVNSRFIGLSETQINWKPEPKKWSIAECLSHIAVSHELYLARVAEVLETPVENNGKLVFRPSITGSIFLKTINPESAVKIPNPAIFNPAESPFTRRVFEDFLSAHQKYVDLLNRSGDYELNDNKIISPVSSLMKFSLGEVLILLAYHEKRHVLQALKVLEHPHFPV